MKENKIMVRNIERDRTGGNIEQRCNRTLKIGYITVTDTQHKLRCLRYLQAVTSQIKS